MNEIIVPPIARERDLSQRFIEGLKKYNLTLEEINSGKFTYAGGNGAHWVGYNPNRYMHYHRNSHYNYFMLRFPDYEFPEQRFECVCDHAIVENCYIYHEEKGFLVLGICCIKRFMDADLTGRTCDKCKRPHKNRKWNLCNDCKPSRKKKQIVIMIPR
jgi:hypothetical protein